MKLPLCFYGDPLLREKAEPIYEITEEIRQFAKDLIESMLIYDGIGLAATQVGKMVRLFVSNIAAEDENGEILIGEPKVFINPVISNYSDILVERTEGCVSIPKLRAPVIRPLTMVMEYMDLSGKQHKEEFQRYVARCMMHEADHLDGLLFVDRIKGKKRTELEPALRMIKQKYYRS